MGEKAQAGELLEDELAYLREELDAMAAKGDADGGAPAAAPGPGRGDSRLRAQTRDLRAAGAKAGSA